MELGEKIQAAKPYIKGFVAGLVVAPIVAFSFSLVVTTGTMNAAVTDARVEQLAALCANEATAYWTAQNNEMAALNGWKNRDARQNLAKQFATQLPEVEPIRNAVVDRCGKLLDV